MESGTPIEEVCRKLGINQQTFYRWKKKFAGMGVEELRRLKSLEDENRRLKSLVARPESGQADSSGRPFKKALRPARLRQAVDRARECYRISERRGYQAKNLLKTMVCR